MPDEYGLTWRDHLELWWIGVRKRLRKCPECERRGYGGNGYRWVDDKVVQVCGFETAPHRCNTCVEKNDLSNSPGSQADQ